jgi:hypothetical protein
MLELPTKTIVIPSPTTYESPQDLLVFKGAIANNSNIPVKFDLLINDNYLEYQVNLEPQQTVVGNWKIWLEKGDRLTCNSPDINTQGFGYFDIDTMDEWLENWDNTTEWLALFDSEAAQQSQGILMILGILT